MDVADSTIWTNLGTLSPGVFECLISDFMTRWEMFDRVQRIISSDLLLSHCKKVVVFSSSFFYATDYLYPPYDLQQGTPYTNV